MDQRPVQPPSVDPSDRFKSHWWWRPGWSPGQRMFTFFLTFQYMLGTAQELLAHYESALSTEALDIVPPEWMHLTVQGLGFVEAVPAAEVDAVVSELGKRCANKRPILTGIGSPTVAEEGVVVKV